MGKESQGKEVKEISQIFSVPWETVRPFAENPRQEFDKQQLQDLADSISLSGQRVPVEVIRVHGKGKVQFELVDGERRWQAIQLAKTIPTIKVFISDVKNKEEQFKASVAVNFNRAEHTAVERARAAKRLSEMGITQIGIGKIMGISAGSVAQHMSILKLPANVLKLMSIEEPVESRIVFTTACLLTTIASKVKQVEIARKISKESLPLSQAKHLIFKLNEEAGGSKGGRQGKVRRPGKTFHALAGFLKRTQTALDMAVDHPAMHFKRMLGERSEKEKGEMFESIEAIITLAEKLKKQVSSAS